MYYISFNMEAFISACKFHHNMCSCISEKDKPTVTGSTQMFDINIPFSMMKALQKESFL